MSLNNLKVSIIVPVYNSEKYIKKCIESLIMQTYGNIEIIFVIDTKKDKSTDIINKYSLKDRRIKIVDMVNKGAMSNRLEGLKNSTGEYVMFVDSDDYIDNDTIEKLIVYIKKYPNYNIDLVRFGYIRESKKFSNKVKIINTEKFILRSDFKNCIYKRMLSSYLYNSLWGQLIKKSKIDLNKVDTSLVMGEDFSFNMGLYNDIDNILLIPDCLYHYLENDTSVTNEKSFNFQLKYMQDIMKIYRKSLKYMKLWDINDTKDKKNICLFILKEITGHAIRIFYDNKLTKEHLTYFFAFICTNGLLNSIRKIITVEDIMNQKTKMKRFMKHIYNRNINACIYEGKYIFFNGYKFMIFLNKIKKNRRNK